MPRLRSLPPLAALLVLAALAACTPDAPVAPAPHALAVRVASADAAPAAGVPVEATRAQLERAADGLLYTSESDYPFLWFFQAGPLAAPLTVESFRALRGVPADVAVERVTLDDFFARHIERVDPYDSAAVALVPRYRHLRETLRRAVPGVAVFRVGRIAIDCFIVGVNVDGDVVGLTTVAIET